MYIVEGEKAKPLDVAAPLKNMVRVTLVALVNGERRHSSISHAMSPKRAEGYTDDLVSRGIVDKRGVTTEDSVNLEGFGSSRVSDVIIEKFDNEGDCTRCTMSQIAPTDGNDDLMWDDDEVKKSEKAARKAKREAKD